MQPFEVKAPNQGHLPCNAGAFQGCFQPMVPLNAIGVHSQGITCGAEEPEHKPMPD